MNMPRQSNDVAESHEHPQLVKATEEFLSALEAGENPSVRDFVARYPDVGQELRDCLENLEFLHNIAPQLSDGGPRASTAAAAGKLEPLATLGDFRIVREIGRGGMGVVYSAEQLSLGRQVALKILPFASVLDSRQLKRFKGEAQAAAMLHHPNIVPVFGTGTDRGVHYFAMQLIEGVTLADVIEDLKRIENDEADVTRAAALDVTIDLTTGRSSSTSQPPTSTSHLPDGTVEPRSNSAASDDSARQAEPTVRNVQAQLSTVRSIKSSAYVRSIIELGIQVADALDHAHEEGVIHRDIKPSNLILDNTCKPWLTDFGLALMEADPGLTMTGDLIGTLRYMSPEQALGRRVAIDHRTDIYSLCATLYELLTLRPVFAGKDRQEIIKQISFEEPRRLRKVNRRVPKELETLILKGLEKNPEHRFGSSKALADDLRRVLDSRPIQAKPPTPLQRLSKFASRNRTLVASAACLLVLAAVGLTISNWFIRGERDAKEAALQRAESNLRLAMSAIDEIYLEPLGGSRVMSLSSYLPKDAMVLRTLDTSLSPGDRKRVLRGLSFYQQMANQNSGEQLAQIESAKAHARAGLLHANLQQNELARREYDKAANLLTQLSDSSPEDTDLRMELAEVYYFRARLSEWWPGERRAFIHVANEASNVLKLDPSNLRALEIRAKAYMAVSEFDLAIRDLENAIELRPADHRLHFLLGAIFDFIEGPEARRLLENAIELGGEGAATSDELASYHESLAWCYQRNQQRAKAVAARKTAADMSTDAESKFRLLCAIDQTNKSWKSIVSRATKRIEETPQSFAPFCSRAEAHAKLGQEDQALADAKIAITLARTDWDCIKLGQVLSSLHEYELAESAFRNAISRNANNHYAYIRFGRMLEKHVDKSLALEMYEKALQLQPAFASCVSAVVESLAEKDKYDEALEILNRALSLTPQAWIHRRRAEIFLKQGNTSQAINEFKTALTMSLDTVGSEYSIEALEEDPEFYLAYRTTIRDIVGELDDQIRQTPHDPKLLAYRGHLNAVLGNLQRSRLDRLEVLRLDPNDDGTRFCLTRDFVRHDEPAAAGALWRNRFADEHDFRLAVNTASLVALIYLHEGNLEDCAAMCEGMLSNTNIKSSLDDRFFTLVATTAHDLFSEDARVLDLAFSLPKNHARYEYLLAAALYRSERLVEAKEIFDQISSDQSPSSWVYAQFYLSLIQEAQGNLDSAIQRYAEGLVEAQAANFGTFDSHRLQLPVLVRECEARLPSERLSPAVEMARSRAMSRWRTVLKDEPGDGVTTSHLVNTLALVREFKEVRQRLAFYRQARGSKELAEMRGGLSEKQSIDSLLSLVLLIEGDLDGHRNVVKRIRQSLSSAPTLGQDMSFAWFSSLSPQVNGNALLRFCQANLEPQMLAHRRIFGVAYYRAGRYQEAISALQTTIDQSPIHSAGQAKSLSRFLLALAFHGLGDQDKAMAWLRRAEERALWDLEKPTCSMQTRLEIEVLRRECERTLARPKSFDE